MAFFLGKGEEKEQGAYPFQSHPFVLQMMVERVYGWRQGLSVSEGTGKGGGLAGLICEGGCFDFADDEPRRRRVGWDGSGCGFRRNDDGVGGGQS